MQIYLVGGAVRDELLSRPVIDRDYVVVGASVEQMLSLGYTQVGKDFPVFLHPHSKAEYALARMERKQGQGYGGFICDFSPDITLEQDLYRRDLTINAIAKDENGTLVDPYHGLQDIAQRRLKHVSPAFSEDPLRVLRVARFAARYDYLGFTIAKETQQLMADMVANGELATLTKERIWLEIDKSLSDGCVAIFSDELNKLGALPIVLPMLKHWSIEHAAELAKNIAVLSKQSDNFKLISFSLWLSTCSLSSLDNIEQTLKAPNKYAQSVRDFCQHKALLSDSNLNAQSVLDMLNKLDIWRRPERFDIFCQTASAAQINPVCITQIQQAALHACAIKPQGIISQGFKGSDIKHQLNLARFKALEQSLEA
ncbi:Multifunctional CCA protein [Pseudoalteromonas holothuriae]|uniref:Multifunctional CCA protein n=1 Tax=Pseudoalteromonas holothuriae TaxID=2963714 RepID=A0A9W4W034_9GAMM|nr:MULTISPECIES: tRNA nucleotidyltransferase [unclassified Pseudoalteromonas]CAH9059395.1 Multifunctional CCA protein [Pseudoalteromonas sp. CIP111854]CAH9064393.1 Multifunctional CCA protein [Pseudoalteromonas sp. CIP111951]